MACKPDLIVFDEPTTALDVTTQIEVLAAIKDAIRELNSAAIYISHDLAVVAQVSDRIMVLRYGGNGVEVGNARQMIASPKEGLHPGAALGAQGAGRQGAHHPEEGETLLEVNDVSASYGGPGGVPVLEGHRPQSHPLQHHCGGGRVRKRQEHAGAGHHRAPPPPPKAPSCSRGKGAAGRDSSSATRRCCAACR